MLNVRWTGHALDALDEREINRDIADLAIESPQSVERDGEREVRMRQYFDEGLGQQMLLRVVVEETELELVIITVYRTSQIQRYLRGSGP
jgi:hypothetical protein